MFGIIIMNKGHLKPGNGMSPVDHQAIIVTNQSTSCQLDPKKQNSFHWNLSKKNKNSFKKNAFQNIHLWNDSHFVAFDNFRNENLFVQALIC